MRVTDNPGMTVAGAFSLDAACDSVQSCAVLPRLHSSCVVLVIGCSSAPTTVGHPPNDEGPARAARVEDFEQLWSFVEAEYPFFTHKSTDWQRVRVEGLAAAQAASDELAFLHVLEWTLDQLYDPHCMLGTNADDSWRPVPGDLWVEQVDDRVLVTAVQRGSPAETAGVRIGQVVTAIDGRSIEEAIALRYPSTLEPGVEAAEAWALLSAAAGTHAGPHAITVETPTGTQTLSWPSGQDPLPPVRSHELAPGVGYIAISSFTSPEIVDAFDDALEEFRNHDALVLDVRSNRGGDTAVARPIMGRFVDSRTPYAKMARRQGPTLGPTWDEFVEPRGPWTFEGEVVVVVDRLSISMAEGFAMGMRGMGRAKIVGTQMAGLGAAIGRVNLPHLQITAQISTEPVYAVSGQPRWELRPDVVVGVTDIADDPDPFLATALATVQHSHM